MRSVLQLLQPSLSICQLYHNLPSVKYFTRCVPEYGAPCDGELGHFDECVVNDGSRQTPHGLPLPNAYRLAPYRVQPDGACACVLIPLCRLDFGGGTAAKAALRYLGIPLPSVGFWQ